MDTKNTLIMNKYIQLRQILVYKPKDIHIMYKYEPKWAIHIPSYLAIYRIAPSNYNTTLVRLFTVVMVTQLIKNKAICDKREFTGANVLVVKCGSI